MLDICVTIQRLKPLWHRYQELLGCGAKLQKYQHLYVSVECWSLGNITIFQNRSEHACVHISVLMIDQSRCVNDLLRSQRIMLVLFSTIYIAAIF